MRNPLADTRMPQDEPHHRHEGMRSQPMHKHKVRHHGRPAVEMSRSHGARASAKGRDMHMGNELPGKKEPSGVQRVGNNENRSPGSRMGKGMSDKAMGPIKPVR